MPSLFILWPIKPLVVIPGEMLHLKLSWDFDFFFSLENFIAKKQTNKQTNKKHVYHFKMQENEKQNDYLHREWAQSQGDEMNKIMDLNQG